VREREGGREREKLAGWQQHTCSRREKRTAIIVSNTLQLLQ